MLGKFKNFDKNNQVFYKISDIILIFETLNIFTLKIVQLFWVRVNKKFLIE